MWIRILGSAAGGGLPQWNCRCANCDAARRGGTGVRPRTQSSVAVSADRVSWFLLNVSADVRAQLAAASELWPPAGKQRGTPIAGCILTDAEIDHTSGLLQLREGCTFGIYCTEAVRRWLQQDLPIGPILSSFADRKWTELRLGAQLDLPLPDGKVTGLRMRPFEVGQDVPRFVRKSANAVAGAVIGVEIEDIHTGGKLVYAPGLPTINAELRSAAELADCVLVDGTFWSDDEPAQMGISTSTATEMGHVPVSGTTGTLAWLSNLPAQHRVYVHMNNTNPILNEQSPEYRLVAERGIRVGRDGDVFEV